MADRLTGKPFATRSEVLGCNGMVASSQPLATQAGVEILKAGGSALDAAIAVNACLGLMEPTGCGIGGDLFALIWDSRSGRLHGLNGSGRSARSASLGDLMERLLRDGKETLPELGPLSVTVPGCVDAWFTLHERFGRLSMEQLLAPAIHYAEAGFPVSELIAWYWQKSLEERADFAGFRESFTEDGTRTPAKGDLWRNPALASTLRQLARHGRAEFYEGDLAVRMGDFLEQQGSFLRFEDFAAHTSTWVDPVSVTYRGFEVWELPPNGQGLAVLQMLNLLEGFPLAEYGFGSPEALHCAIESKKLAFADRARFYADPDFYDLPLARLVSKEYGDALRSRLDLEKAARQILPDPENLRAGDTVYLCTADGTGNMVSLIQSNFWGMGSGLCPPGMGFGFQNRGCAFALEPEHPNAYAPAKRPFHTIIPAFLTQQGRPLCAFGVMGGDTQPQAQVQVVCNLLDFGMNLQEAGDAPRWVHSGDSDPAGSRMSDGGTVSLEHGFSTETIRELSRRGHRLAYGCGEFGGYQAIWRDPDTGVYSGASESRKDGQAAGF